MQVVILVPQGAHSLEVAGPRDVFAEANLRADKLLYDFQVVAEANGPVACDSGLRLIPDKTIDEVQEDVDTLIVAGPRRVRTFEPSSRTTAWLRQRAPRARRYGSVCTGAFVLGPTGLLDGRHVTTHWEYAEDFARAFPAALLEPDHIFVRDGPLFTSAGVTAGIDLALTLVEEDHGRELALSIARWLVMYLKRSGGQSQFSVHLAAQIAERSPVEHVRQWILDNPRADLSARQLANQAGMSERNFSRVFRGQTGMTPGDYVEVTRIDMARRLLEGTILPMQRIASISGFANTDIMRRAFLRRIAVTPLDYRRRFQTSRPSESGVTAP